MAHILYLSTSLVMGLSIFSDPFIIQNSSIFLFQMNVILPILSPTKCPTCEGKTMETPVRYYHRIETQSYG